MGPIGVVGDGPRRASSRSSPVDRSRSVECRRRADRCAGRRVALANVGDLHRTRVYPWPRAARAGGRIASEVRGSGHRPKVTLEYRNWGMHSPGRAPHAVASHMPPSTNADRTIPGDGDLVEPQSDARSRQLARPIRAVAVAAAMVGGLETLFGLAYGEARQRWPSG